MATSTHTTAQKSWYPIKLSAPEITNKTHTNSLHLQESFLELTYYINLLVGISIHWLYP